MTKRTVRIREYDYVVYRDQIGVGISICPPSNKGCPKGQFTCMTLYLPEQGMDAEKEEDICLYFDGSNPGELTVECFKQGKFE